MATRIHNFSAGPATLPTAVLEKAQSELLDFNGLGMSVMEISHRSKPFISVHEETKQRFRDLLSIPERYEILFLQGGASLQFHMVPLNLIRSGCAVDVVNTGSWTKKAIAQVKALGDVREVASSANSNFDHIPTVVSDDFNTDASYAFITSNNTIFGTQWRDFPDTGDVPLVADMSSDILSRPFDIENFALVFAGAQKNLGPAGVTVVILKKDLADRCDASVATMLQYRTHIEKDSMYNTPPTFGIYLMGLVLDWIQAQGGLSAMAAINERKAGKLYAAIDASDAFYCPVRKDSRSLMNVVFRIQGDDEELEKRFVKEAEEAGLSGLKGHRSVGGLRASIYNALPQASVDALLAFMKAFEAKHASKLAASVAR